VLDKSLLKGCGIASFGLFLTLSLCMSHQEK
jgi:hypothetical protein